MKILSRQNEMINFVENDLLQQFSKIITVVIAYDMAEIFHHSIGTKNLGKFRPCKLP